MLVTALPNSPRLAERMTVVGGPVIARQALRFAAVGVVGFFVDAGVLTLAMSLLGLNIYTARVLSFLTAVTATWAMNRAFTFKQRASPSMVKEWVRFCAANAVGGLVNLGTYVLLVNTVTIAHDLPVVGVAAGSLAGLAVNFTLSRIFVFHGKDVPTPAAHP
jgi:putative flippase GtrA